MKDLQPFFNFMKDFKVPQNKKFILLLVVLVLDGIARIQLYKNIPDIVNLVEQILKALGLI